MLKVVTHNVEKLLKNSLKKAAFKNLSLKLGGAESDNVRTCNITAQNVEAHPRLLNTSFLSFPITVV